jgi:hypothetical protein
MPEREVNSPVNSRNTTSKLRSNLPLSPGAKSNPSAGGPKFDSVPPQPQHRTATHEEPPIPGGTTVVTGPED